jgi:hypothetical protein
MTAERAPAVDERGARVFEDLARGFFAHEVSILSETPERKCPIEIALPC